MSETKHIGDRYLRNRPFLIVNSISRPAKGANTHVRGWAEVDSNWALFEQPMVVDRVSDKQMTEASVIIDVLNRKVVKNRFAAQGDDSVLEHFLSKYTEMVTEGLVAMARRQGMIDSSIKDIASEEEVAKFLEEKASS